MLWFGRGSEPVDVEAPEAEPVADPVQHVRAPAVGPAASTDVRGGSDEALEEPLGGRNWAQVVCTLHAEADVPHAKVEIMAEELFEGVDVPIVGAKADVVDGQMRFKVVGPAGSLRWTVSGYQEAWSYWEGAEVGGEVACSVELEPGHSNVVMGTVVDLDGQPVERALVQGCDETVSSAADGSFELVTTSTEPCTVSATWTGQDEDGRLMALSTTGGVEVDLSQGDAHVDLVVEDLRSFLAGMKDEIERMQEEIELTEP
ncbi:MAG: hypothetical protein GY884_20640 [Proteobacteria bacterium]|nr:hypothetical protein [Pseudomonadota bacterium]